MDYGNGATNLTDGVDEVFQNNKPTVECDVGLETSEGDALGKPGYYSIFFRIIWYHISNKYKSISYRGRAQELYSKMPVTKYSTHYKMDHKKRGLAYIFNHESFECGGLKARTGTNEDCRNLKECLVWLGFDVQVFKDLNFSDIEFHMRQGEEIIS